MSESVFLHLKTGDYTSTWCQCFPQWDIALLTALLKYGRSLKHIFSPFPRKSHSWHLPFLRHTCLRYSSRYRITWFANNFKESLYWINLQTFKRNTLLELSWLREMLNQCLLIAEANWRVASIFRILLTPVKRQRETASEKESVCTRASNPETHLL